MLLKYWSELFHRLKVRERSRVAKKIRWVVWRREERTEAEEKNNKTGKVGGWGRGGDV